MHQELRVARGLTWRYVIALTLVAVLTTAAWISLRLVIAEQKSMAAVVNISGRQRMLSQRTALFSSLLVSATVEARPAYRSKLREAIDLMERSHNGLTRGDSTQGLPDTLSPTVRRMYFDGPDALDPLVRGYLRSVHALLDKPDGELRHDDPVLRHIIEVSPTVLVYSLDRMVSQYQKEGEAAITRLQQAETLVWIITLVLLFLEASFIFRPFTQRMQGVIARLQKTTDDLFESREHLRIVTENAIDCLWKTDAGGRLIEFRSLAASLPSPEEAIGHSLTSRISEDTDPEQGAALQEAVSAHAAYRDLVIRVRTGMPAPVWVRASGVPYFSPQGDFQGYLGVWTDITGKIVLEQQVLLHQKELEERVRERTLDLEHKSRQLEDSEEKFRLISAAAFDAIIMIDRAGRLTYWNPAARNMFGHEAEEVLGKEIHSLIAAPSQQEAIQRGLQAFLHGGKGAVFGSTREVLAMRKGGEEFPAEISVSVLFIRGQRHAVGIVRDVSERRKAEECIRQLAYYDTVTALPNRRLLHDRLEHALGQARRHRFSVALLFLDLDGFKQINDTLGHDIGDELLRAVAIRLCQEVRSGDTVSRQGGDEFVVVLPDIGGPEDADVVARKFLQALEKPLPAGGHQLSVTMSIGIAIASPDDPCDIQTLMKQADMAMYAAKQGGKNGYRHYTPAACAGA